MSMELCLAIDIGGTKIAVGLVNRAGELVDRTHVLVNPRISGDELFEDVAEAVGQQLLRATEHHGVRPSVIGVGSAGPITTNVETVSPLNILQWRQFPLRQLMLRGPLPFLLIQIPITSMAKLLVSDRKDSLALNSSAENSAFN